MERCGRIEVIFGPMFSGKSTELIRRIRRHHVANEDCLVIKYSKDTRYGDDCTASTHDLTHWDAIPCTASLMNEVLEPALAHHVVGIDEGQFFPDIDVFCERLAIHGIVVIVAALDATFEGKPFGRILNLVPMAEDVCKLKAVCERCQADASFSYRRPLPPSLAASTELIGGSETYAALCRQCYHSERGKTSG